MNLHDLSIICRTRINDLMQHYLRAEPQLQEAMLYSALNGGKRIRPLLVYATGYSLGASLDALDGPACAVELIHTYSLIHDDLPAMDNADMRRGKASCHKAFNEALAILAGDALQPLAFEILASHPTSLTANQQIEMIKILSRAIGPLGMVGGQSYDLQSAVDLDKTYQLKTGALLSACVNLGIIASGTEQLEKTSALLNYINHLGLAFQIQDDLLDFESEEITGKPTALDTRNQKKTFPLLFGKEYAKQRLNDLFSMALSALNVLSPSEHLLNDFAYLLLGRSN